MPADRETTGRAAPGRLAILYDGGCQICRVMVDRIRAFDNSGALDMLDLHDLGVRSAFAGLEFARLMEQLHAVDEHGRVFRGARAVNEILRRQRGIIRLFALLWHVPGYARLADWQYRRVARSRYRDALGRVVHPEGWR
jgi:predicted DCC family thiol-disulfide oxidoreductase YuxK